MKLIDDNEYICFLNQGEASVYKYHHKYKIFVDYDTNSKKIIIRPTYIDFLCPLSTYFLHNRNLFNQCFSRQEILSNNMQGKLLLKHVAWNGEVCSEFVKNDNKIVSWHLNDVPAYLTPFYTPIIIDEQFERIEE